MFNRIFFIKTNEGYFPDEWKFKNSEAQNGILKALTFTDNFKEPVYDSDYYINIKNDLCSFRQIWHPKVIKAKFNKTLVFLDEHKNLYCEFIRIATGVENFVHLGADIIFTSFGQLYNYNKITTLINSGTNKLIDFENSDFYVLNNKICNLNFINSFGSFGSFSSFFAEGEKREGKKNSEKRKITLYPNNIYQIGLDYYYGNEIIEIPQGDILYISTTYILSFEKIFKLWHKKKCIKAFKNIIEICGKPVNFWSGYKILEN